MYKEDGVDHINIYSKGQTELGRLLSNFANTPFELFIDGWFASIEAYWYWLVLQISCTPEQLPSVEETLKLRKLYGFAAKKYGRVLLENCLKGGAWSLEQEKMFKGCIRNAFCAKLNWNPQIKEMLKQSSLPFTHYYNYNGKIVQANAHQWQVDFWEKTRTSLKDNLLF